MPITFNGTNITAINFNGYGGLVNTVVFNGTTVFTSAATWEFVEVYSSDPGFQDIFYEGDGSGGNITGMINEMNSLYDPAIYSGLYLVYYDTYDGQYYFFVTNP
jgi:hypothetical protein